MLALEKRMLIVRVIEKGKLTPMPRVAPVMAHDTMFSLVV